ncbi:MAG: isocitrate lyase/phosphoenolpyruvate mutase family protein [Algicola sp.]|nr:isocitrate lyase/phosphoenolpyruvate mutase family protein [Algicola sp.]
MNKEQTFKAMHQQAELLFLPNAWDVISAMVLEQAGFKAVGTTSWGVSNALGYKDGENIEFSELLTLVGKMVAVLSIPLTVDIESGYAQSDELIAENVLKIADLGVAGINFEDSLKNTTAMVDKQTQCGLIEKIRNKLDSHGHTDFFINARTDTYFQLKDPLGETISRAVDYVASGASGIFVPGLSQADEIKQIVDAIDAPLNVMSLSDMTDVGELNKLGVKRFSVGNALSDATTAFIEQQARQILTQQNTASLYDHGEVKTVFRPCK